MGLRAGLDRCGKSRPYRHSIPGPSSPLAVAIPTTLPGPLTDSLNIIYYFHGSTALVGLRLLIVEVSISHADTPHSVRLFRMSDRPVGETST